MVSFTSLAVVLTTAIGALALPRSQHEENANTLFRRQTPSSSGYHDGWYYNFWSDGEGQHNYTNLPSGRYNVSWGHPGNFFGGKGWEIGKVDR
jgi:endo-1,4-beta-xylanase